ncbi:MAG TPA: DNA adenine methylase [Pirellulales bacterium]|nr:DNA adenine methylase [Pirellulales bacterium]
MTARTLFPGITVEPPATEGIKYAGSKLKLLRHIIGLAASVGAETILDGFSGSTRVSQAFAQAGYQVIANDVAVWSKVFGTCYLLNKMGSAHYSDLIKHLNAVPPKDGWFTEHYGGLSNGGCSIQADGLKRPWQAHNTRRLDGIREEIENLKLAEIENAVALTSLIRALDEVDNTLGHFVSYLKEWSPRSYNALVLKIPRLLMTERRHEVLQDDIFEVLENRGADLAYFDPPYGSNNEKMPPSRVRYASYYHLWTSVCLFDKPALFGKAKRRKDSSDRISPSIFEEFRRGQSGRFKAVEAIDRLIRSARAKWVILCYSSGGRATSEELNEVLHGNGRILEVIELDYKRNVMAEMKWTSEWVRDADVPNREFLFLIEK